MGNRTRALNCKGLEGVIIDANFDQKDVKEIAIWTSPRYGGKLRRMSNLGRIFGQVEVERVRGGIRAVFMRPRRSSSTSVKAGAETCCMEISTGSFAIPWPEDDSGYQVGDRYYNGPGSKMDWRRRKVEERIQ
jgi:hypothetical protein